MAEVKVKWHEKRAGEESAGRIIAMMGAVTGCAIALAGTVGMFVGVDSSMMIGGGTGMFSAATASKAFQANGENRGAT